MLVVSGATGGDDEGGTSATQGSTTAERGASSTSTDDGASRGSTTTAASGATRRSYRVEAGDTLGSIAAANGLTTEELQELNPDVDPQSLTVGQRLRLRR